MAPPPLVSKQDFLQVLELGKLVSSAVMEKLTGYPDGTIAQVRGLLETELPKAARSAELGIDEGSIREMIDYAEGYQGFACFPETTVRTAVKQAVSNLRGPISAVLTQLRAGVGADVCSAVEGCQRSILAQAKNSQVAEDLETRLLTECNALLSTWFEDAARMVDSLVSMEHELPDMQVLGDLFRGAGVDIGKREESGSGSEKGAGQQQRKFVMGHLQKKNATTGTWSKRWCVIEPSEQKLVIYKGASKEPSYAIDMAKVEVDDLIGGPVQGKSKGSKDKDECTFLLKTLHPFNSTVPTKTRSSVCFKATSPEVKELWLSSLEPLCGSSSSSESDGTDNDTCSDASRSTEVPESTAPSEELSVYTSHPHGRSSHTKARFAAEGVDKNIEIFSTAVTQYMQIVREQLLLSVPKAVTYLFLEKITDTFSDGLVNRLVESM